MFEHFGRSDLGTWIALGLIGAGICILLLELGVLLTH
jgi:hypothetical protein